jgi:hypothetical protein
MEQPALQELSKLQVLSTIQLLWYSPTSSQENSISLIFFVYFMKVVSLGFHFSSK